MRGSVIWFLLAVAWALDAILAIVHRNLTQAALTAFFALCFLAAGLFFRKRERKLIRPAKRPQ